MPPSVPVILRGTVLTFLFSSCSGSPAQPTVNPFVGVWGGDHIVLTVTEMRSSLEFDCAHGDIPGALMANGAGAFMARGTFNREHGGPIREGEIPDTHPAWYAGTVSGTAMRLTVHLIDANEVIGSFDLARDAPGRVLKCL